MVMIITVLMIILYNHNNGYDNRNNNNGYDNTI